MSVGAQIEQSGVHEQTRLLAHSICNDYLAAQASCKT